MWSYSESFYFIYTQAQIKYNFAGWMVSKQKVRRNILNADAWHNDVVRTNINFMLKWNLWDADIFSQEASEDATAAKDDHSLEKQLGVDQKFLVGPSCEGNTE